jgi:hypothetical protein
MPQCTPTQYNNKKNLKKEMLYIITLQKKKYIQIMKDAQAKEKIVAIQTMLK